MPIRHAVMAVSCLLVIGCAVWFALSGPSTSEAEVYLDASLVLRSEGTTYAFTVDRAGPVILAVDMPERCEKDGRLSISPLYVALRPDPVYERDPRPEHVIPVPHTGIPATRIDLQHAGAYVLRMEPIPMAMAHEGAPPEARVRIVRAR